MTSPHAPTPILLVHGWCGSAEAWRPIVDILDRRRWDPVAIALPGSRDGERGPATVRGAAAALVRRLRTSRGPAVILGHSLGAQVTMLAHGRAAARVAAEVVVDPAYGADPGSSGDLRRWADEIERDGRPALERFFAGAVATMPPESASRVIQDFRETPVAAIVSYLCSEYLDEGAIGLLPATRRAAARRVAPVLSLHSTTASALRESALPTTHGSRSEQWSDHGHFLHLEDPLRFADLLSAWHDELEAQGGLTAPGRRSREA